MPTDYQRYQILKIIEQLKIHSNLSDNVLIKDNFSLDKFGPQNEFKFKPTNTVITFEDRNEGPYLSTLIPMKKFAQYNLSECRYIIGNEGNPEPVISVYDYIEKKYIIFDKINDFFYVSVIIRRFNHKSVEMVKLPPYILNDEEFLLMYRLIDADTNERKELYKYVPYFLGPQKEFDLTVLKQQLDVYDMYKY